MKLPTLYKLNVNKSINQWTIYIEGNCYWSEFGKIDGALQTSEKTVCNGKNIGKTNETTDEKQALIEATSIWNMKQKMENFVQDICLVNEILFKPPMLAKIYNKEYNENMKFIQPKLDGVRCNISVDDGGIKSISRRNKRFATTRHIENELIVFFAEHPTIHLDGELYNHDLHNDFNKIVSLVKKEKLNEMNRKEIERTVKYYVYDLWDDANPNMTFSERSEMIHKFLSGYENIMVVQTKRISSSDDIESYFRDFIHNGYEGAIIRTDTPYEHKRSNNLLKYKEFYDGEFEVLDVNLGKNQTIAESVTIRLNEEGKTCNATLAFLDEQCKEIWENKEKYIGKTATVCHFGFTADGSLRFPVVKSFNRESYE